MEELSDLEKKRAYSRQKTKEHYDRNREKILEEKKPKRKEYYQTHIELEKARSKARYYKKKGNEDKYNEVMAFIEELKSS
jgi:hypothetical protein